LWRWVPTDRRHALKGIGAVPVSPTAPRQVMDLLTAVSEKDRIPGKEAVARIELALALVRLGAADEAGGLGCQALSAERLAVPVRARALELDAALRRGSADLPEAREFHERCRLLTQSSPLDLAT
jgi:hypothetical protein